MPKLMAEPLPPGCPWSGWTPPNVDWCEEELCSWIVNPADTWSNLAYIAAGLLMWAGARRKQGRENDAILGLFAPVSVLVGIFSFAYHASYTYFLQFFDFVGMFLFCFTVITANALRLGWVDAPRRWVFLLAGVAGFSALVPLLSQTTVPIQSLVGLLIALIIGQEIAIRRRLVAGVASSPRTPYGAFFLALALLAAAAVASAADVTRTFCDPTNHWLQGHAIWHLLSAASLYALFVFYRELPRDVGTSSLAPGSG